MFRVPTGCRLDQTVPYLLQLYSPESSGMFGLRQLQVKGWFIVFFIPFVLAPVLQPFRKRGVLFRFTQPFNELLVRRLLLKGTRSEQLHHVRLIEHLSFQKTFCHLQQLSTSILNEKQYQLRVIDSNACGTNEERIQKQVFFCTYNVKQAVTHQLQ